MDGWTISLSIKSLLPFKLLLCLKTIFMPFLAKSWHSLFWQISSHSKLWYMLQEQQSSRNQDWSIGNHTWPQIYFLINVNYRNIFMISSQENIMLSCICFARFFSRKLCSELQGGLRGYNQKVMPQWTWLARTGWTGLGSVT